MKGPPGDGICVLTSLVRPNWKALPLEPVETHSEAASAHWKEHSDQHIGVSNEARRKPHTQRITSPTHGDQKK